MTNIGHRPCNETSCRKILPSSESSLENFSNFVQCNDVDGIIQQRQNKFYCFVAAFSPFMNTLIAFLVLNTSYTHAYTLARTSNSFSIGQLFSKQRKQIHWMCAFNRQLIEFYFFFFYSSIAAQKSNERCRCQVLPSHKLRRAHNKSIVVALNLIQCLPLTKKGHWNFIDVSSISIDNKLIELPRGKNVRQFYIYRKFQAMKWISIQEKLDNDGIFFFLLGASEHWFGIVCLVCFSNCIFTRLDYAKINRKMRFENVISCWPWWLCSTT